MKHAPRFRAIIPPVLLAMAVGCAAKKDPRSAVPVPDLVGDARIVVIGLDRHVPVGVTVAQERNQAATNASALLFGAVGVAVAAAVTAVDDPWEDDRRAASTIRGLLGEEHPGSILRRNLGMLLSPEAENRIVFDERPRPDDAVLEVMIVFCTITESGKGLEYEVETRLHLPGDWAAVAKQGTYRCGTSERLCSPGIPKAQKASFKDLIAREGELLRSQLDLESRGIAEAILEDLGFPPEAGSSDTSAAEGVGE